MHAPGRSRVALLAWAGVTGLALWWTLLPFSWDLSPSALLRALKDVQWIPLVERGRPPLWSDVLGNWALFAPFGLAGWRALEGRPRRAAWLAAAALALSVGIEALQLAVPARRTSATDVAVDVLGALLGAGLGCLWEAGGRDAGRRWAGGFARGESAHAAVCLLSACLVVWAALPGSTPSAGVWRQTQLFSASFRRFPGWGPWLAGSAHPMLLGACFAALVARSVRGGTALRWLAGAAAALVAGLVLESLQLLAPSRRPDIFQALALGAGGAAGALLGRRRRRTVLAGAAAVLGLGLWALPGGDLPVGETRSVVVMAAGLLAAVGVSEEEPCPRRSS